MWQPIAHLPGETIVPQMSQTTSSSPEDTFGQQETVVRTEGGHTRPTRASGAAVGPQPRCILLSTGDTAWMTQKSAGGSFQGPNLYSSTMVSVGFTISNLDKE